jgi:site-specific DNA recombinase
MAEPKCNAPQPKRSLRCAIYTRKSTEEGLEQDFNSLDAQREAAQAFIRSQQREGWKAVPVRFDDGGFTGANMERPALTRLLAAVRNRAIDCVVVYKVDRLSRSLLDFANIMKLFDEHDVSFVSVTQQFNTSSSLGRLTLHILLSFAQFERELIGERTRDKMSAARKKGKWTGGYPVLGYDIDARGGRLIVNRVEAERVRALFALFENLGSIRDTLEEVVRRGWTLKTWACRNGRMHSGGRFNSNALRRLLSNPLYVGAIPYKGTVYPGEHEAIVDRETWDRAQSLITQYARETAPRRKHDALLRGLLRCEGCDAPMIPIYAKRNETLYRYYICRSRREGVSVCAARPLPAQDIERQVLDRLRQSGSGNNGDLPTDLPEQKEWVRRLVERVDYEGVSGRVSIRLRES